jgi:D-aspartate ligase
LPEHPVAVGLGAVRGLGQQGLDVAAVCPRSETGILRSRYVKQGFVIPTGNGYMDRLEAFLLETFRSGGVLVATSDESAEFLQHRRAVLHEHGFRFLIPHDDTTELLNDKRREIEFIRSLEIPLPRSVSRIHPLEFLHDLRPPIIVKPRRYDGYALIKSKNIIIQDTAGAKNFLTRYAQQLDMFVAQEIIPGDDNQLWVCNCLFDTLGQLRSAFTFQRLGTSPSHFGVTTSAIGFDNPAVKEITREIGESIGYVGPAMFEYKYDARDGEYKYIETNPRLGMCNWFDTCSGVDNVYYYYCLATGQEAQLPSSPPPQKERGFINVLPDLYARIEDRQSPAQILSIQWKALRRRPVFARFVWKDPRPWVTSLRTDLRVGWSGLIRALSKRRGPT